VWWKRRLDKVSEEQVWEGSPSQVRNLGFYVVCALTCWLVVPIFLALWRWMETRCIRFTLTSERLKMASGVFTRRTDEVELYRVKDTALTEPFFLRLFGLGTIELTTTDATTPVVVLPAIAEAGQVRERIRTHVELSRQRRGVRDVEVEHIPHWHE
jgi:uncharacterized membrane protein YdbT with pleckstrin-like domain